MKKIIIIGSDSYIATKFYHRQNDPSNIKLITKKSSNKKDELIINDLFSLNHKDFRGYDTVINFTAIVHQKKTKNHERYKRVNTFLPIHLAQESKKAGIKHFIQFSTVAVFGRVNKVSVDSQEQPIDIYAETKLAADKVLMKMHCYDFNITIIRPPMVYGGGRSPGNMMRLIKIAALGVPLPFKNINNKRDFLHVNNLTNCISIIVGNNIYGIVLPTDKQPVSTYEVINIIEKSTSRKIRLFSINVLIRKLIKITFPGYYYKLFDSLLIKCNLPPDLYTPKYSLEDGIIEMITNK